MGCFGGVFWMPLSCVSFLRCGILFDKRFKFLSSISIEIADGVFKSVLMRCESSGIIVEGG